MELPTSQALVDGAVPKRSPLIDLSELVATYDAKDSDLPRAQISHDCGTYVCNALYYHTLSACEAFRGPRRWADALFVHIPPVSPAEARAIGRQLANILTAITPSLHES